MLEPRTQTRAGVDPVAAGEQPRHAADVVERLRRHLVGRLAVAALVVGERRPAARRAEPAEVGVVLLASSRRRGGSPSPATAAARVGSQSRYGRPSCSPLGVRALRRWEPARHPAESCQTAAWQPRRASQSVAMPASETHATSGDPIAGSAVYPIGSRVNAAGHLEVGGCDVVELAREFGTPAYIYAEDDIRARARAYLDAFARADRRLRGRLREQGGAGHRDLPAVRRGGPLRRRRLGRRAPHGARGPASTRRGSTCTATTRPRPSSLAVESGVGHVVCDSLDEIERLDAICAAGGRRQRVLIRLTPGSGRPRTRTCRPASSTRSSASGSPTGWRRRRSRRCCASRNLDLVGLHAHIGSQIFELEPYVRAIEALAELAARPGAGSSTSAAASGSPTPRRRAAVGRRVRRRQGRGRAPRARRLAADPRRAGTLARRQRRDHRLHGRHGQGDPRRAHLRRGRRRHVRQPAPDALRRRATRR